MEQDLLLISASINQICYSFLPAQGARMNVSQDLVWDHLIPSCRYDVKQFDLAEFVQHNRLPLKFSVNHDSLASIFVGEDLILQRIMRFNSHLNVKACLALEGEEEFQKSRMILDNALKAASDVRFDVGKEFLSFLHVGVCTLKDENDVSEFRSLVSIFDLDLVAKLLEETKIKNFCRHGPQIRLCTFYSTQLKYRDQSVIFREGVNLSLWHKRYSCIVSTLGHAIANCSSPKFESSARGLLGMQAHEKADAKYCIYGISTIMDMEDNNLHYGTLTDFIQQTVSTMQNCHDLLVYHHGYIHNKSLSLYKSDFYIDETECERLSEICGDGSKLFKIGDSVIRVLPSPGESTVVLTEGMIESFHDWKAQWKEQENANSGQLVFAAELPCTKTGTFVIHMLLNVPSRIDAINLVKRVKEAIGCGVLDLKFLMPPVLLPKEFESSGFSGEKLVSVSSTSLMLILDFLIKCAKFEDLISAVLLEFGEPDKSLAVNIFAISKAVAIDTLLGSYYLFERNPEIMISMIQTILKGISNGRPEWVPESPPGHVLIVEVSSVWLLPPNVTE